MDAAHLTDLDEIRRMTEAKAKAEHVQFQGDPEPEQADGGNGNDKEWTGTPTDQEDPAPISPAFVLDCLRSNEDGDARLFIELHRGRFLFDLSAGVWYKWAGHHWPKDFLNEAMAGIKEVISVYGQAAQREVWLRLQADKSGNKTRAKTHKENEDNLLKRVRALQSLNRKKNVLELAKIGTDGLGITGKEWDRDPWLLGCLNGVLELKTGTHRPGRPEDLIKTVASVEWKGLDTPAPNLNEFLSGIFDGNKELADYLQRLLGYSITGHTVEHIFPIFHGVGRNGKGTLFEVLAYVLGPYAGPTEAELILKQKMIRQSGGPTSDIIYLRGKRLVWISETDEGRRLNAGRVKWLSGGDTLTGRGIYDRDQVNFQPSHKLVLLTNHRPHADASDYALFQRLHLIPFTLSFVDDPQKPNERKADKSLLEKLKAESSGVLAWLVRGCLAWQKEGLNPPEAVKAATKAFQEEEDLIGQFISEKCTLGLGLEVQAGTLYKTYQEWTEENGLTAISSVKFGREMRNRFASFKDRNTFYEGVGLL
ncbi:MAG: phage/plasmid primase, P4 family [Thermodesulfobacteriota bacterium]